MANQVTPIGAVKAPDKNATTSGDGQGNTGTGTGTQTGTSSGSAAVLANMPGNNTDTFAPTGSSAAPATTADTFSGSSTGAGMGTADLSKNMPGNTTDTFAPVTINTSGTLLPSTPLSNGSTRTSGAAANTTDTLSYAQPTQTDILSNMPSSNPIAVTAEPYGANTNTTVDDLLNFFPSTDNAVLFSPQAPNTSGGLGAQVSIADGADPNFNVALAALATQNPAAITTMVQPLANNTYNVNFYVAAQPPAELAQPQAAAVFQPQPTQPPLIPVAVPQPQPQTQLADSQPMHLVQVQVTDTFLPNNLPQDAHGNTIMWAALVNKAYAKLADMGMLGAMSDPLTTMTGRQVTTLDANASQMALWNALSLANAPLRVPVTTVTGPPEHHADSNLPSNRAYNVLGTFIDNKGEAMVTLGRPTAAGMREADAAFSVPLQLLQKAVTVTVIADGRPEVDLVGNPGDPRVGPTSANCCMHVRAGGGDGGSSRRDTLRVFDPPARLQDQRCLSCAFARSLCTPQPT